MKNITKTLLMTLLIATCAFVAQSCDKTQTPREVVGEYFLRLQRGHLEKAYSCTCWDRQDIEDLIEKLEGIDFKIKDFETLSEQISEDGENAVVKVRYTYECTFDKGGNEQDTVEEEINLRLVDGKWKIE